MDEYFPPADPSRRHGGRAGTGPRRRGVGDLRRCPPRRSAPHPPPAGAEPVEWVLVTSVPTATVADAWDRVDWCTRRWLVQEDHRGLKTGCRLEAAQLRERDGL